MLDKGTAGSRCRVWIGSRTWLCEHRTGPPWTSSFCSASPSLQPQLAERPAPCLWLCLFPHQVASHSSSSRVTSSYLFSVWMALSFKTTAHVLKTSGSSAQSDRCVHTPPLAPLTPPPVCPPLLPSLPDWCLSSHAH